MCIFNDVSHKQQSHTAATGFGFTVKPSTDLIQFFFVFCKRSKSHSHFYVFYVAYFTTFLCVLNYIRSVDALIVKSKQVICYVTLLFVIDVTEKYTRSCQDVTGG